MRKSSTHLSIFLLLFFISFFSCKNNEIIAPQITLAKDSLSFSKYNGEDILAIKSNVVWTAASSASWCTLTPESGNAGTFKINVSVTENTLNTKREATITITAGSLSKQVKVTQQLTDLLTIENKNFNVDAVGGEITVNIQSTSAINATIGNDWINLKSENSTTKIYTIDANPSTELRNGKIVYESGNVKDSITISQSGVSFNIPDDATGMSSTAIQLAQKIKFGINIGNTLEASGGETGWGNPKINENLIKLIKQSGFKAIRLPCAWDQYADQTTLKISNTWLSRVRQVVKYCVDNDMYVILNIHWDGGWLENNCTVDKQVANNIKQKAYWEQIAISLRDFDEHLLFASANEPNVSDATQMSVLTSYHQTFIDAVRSTGGKNAYRVLVVQGPSTDIDKTNNLMTQMPTDKISDKMMAEVHYYTPWNFCGMTQDESWGKMFYYWGNGYHSTTDTGRNATWGEESDLNSLFLKMKTKFVDKGIPVIVGEFGAIRRDNLTGDALKLHLASRAYFFKYVMKQSIADGFLPFYWDAGGSTGVFNRNNNTVADQQSLDALIQGATE